MTDSQEIHLDQEFHCENDQENDIINEKELRPPAVVQGSRVEQSKGKRGVADDCNNCIIKPVALSNPVHYSPETRIWIKEVQRLVIHQNPESVGRIYQGNKALPCHRQSKHFL